MNSAEARINPYPPSFSKIAARIMDPATGASTCAFGSHKCTEYIGTFTKKARIVNNHQIDAVVRDSGWDILKNRNRDLFQVLIIRIESSSGREAVTVYIRR